MSIFIRFECGSEDRSSVEYGPFEWAQFTYDRLRVPQDTDFAFFVNNEWRLNEDIDFVHGVDNKRIDIDQLDVNCWWSDIVIGAWPGP